MTSYDFSLLHIDQADGVLWATIDAPPINVMTVELFKELATLAEPWPPTTPCGPWCCSRPTPSSSSRTSTWRPSSSAPSTAGRTRAELKGFHLMCETWRTMPKATIVKVAGRVGGGGAELSASCDMRFGLLGRTVVNQMEVPIGILPGGSGTQRLPRLMGRGRAMEIVLGGVDLDAATAERWGWLNRAFATVAELDGYVDGLARRIASFPPQAVINGKAAVLAAEADPLPGLRRGGVPLRPARRPARRPGGHATVPRRRRPDPRWRVPRR